MMQLFPKLSFPLQLWPRPLLCTLFLYKRIVINTSDALAFHFTCKWSDLNNLNELDSRAVTWSERGAVTHNKCPWSFVNTSCFMVSTLNYGAIGVQHFVLTVTMNALLHVSLLRFLYWHQDDFSRARRKLTSSVLQTLICTAQSVLLHSTWNSWLLYCYNTHSEYI